MTAIVNGLEEEFAGEVYFYRLNANEVAVVELQTDYGPRGHPAFAVLDAKNEVTQTFTGQQEAEILRSALAAAAPYS